MTLASDPQAPRSPWGPLLVLSIAIANAFASQGVFSPVQDLAKRDLALSDYELSLVQGIAAAIPVAVLSIPLGRLVDRANRMRMLIALSLAWTLGNAMTAFASGFWSLFASRTLASIGMMCSLPVAISIAADLTAADHRGRAMLSLSLGKILGMAAAFALGGGLIGIIGAQAPAWLGPMDPWRQVHLLFAVGSLVLIAPLLLLREPARHELGGIVDPSWREAVAALWERRELLVPLFLGQVSVVMADVSASIWASAVLIRDYHQQPAQFGPWMGGVVLFSGVLGTVLGGVLADLGAEGRLRGGILFGAAVAAVVSIPAAFFPMMPSVASFAALLTVLLIGGAITGLIASVAIAVIIPNELRGLCLGTFIVVSALLGLGVAPTLVTFVADRLGGESHIREGLTIVAVTTSVVSAIGFVVAMRSSRMAARPSED